MSFSEWNRCKSTSPTAPAPTPTPETTIRLVIATDNHIGCYERDAQRSYESYSAFAEVLDGAKNSGADAVLLGGDLFDVNVPTRATQLKTLRLLRTAVMGSTAVYLSAAYNRGVLHHAPPFEHLNYENPDWNVALPVFVIHGNHDDPVEGSSAIDVLAEAGLVNYFGAQESQDEFVVSPIRLEKGGSRVALFGIGYYADMRYNALLRQGKVLFQKPDAWDDAFAVCLIHQNRYHRNASSTELAVDDNHLPAWLDGVVWGHEHESIPVFKPNDAGVPICQLGSTIITALTESEALCPKHYLIVEVCAGWWRFRAVPLRNVRKLYFEDFVLSQEFEGRVPEQVPEDEIIQKVKDCIRKILEMDALHRPNRPPGFERPLIRIRVNYAGGFPLPRTQLIHADFQDEVANPLDMVQLQRIRKERLPGSRDRASAGDIANMAEKFIEEDAEGGASKIEQLVIDRLVAKNAQFRVFSEKKLTTAVHAYVQSETVSAIPSFVQDEMGRANKALVDARLQKLQRWAGDKAKSVAEKSRARNVTEALQRNASRDGLDDTIDMPEPLQGAGHVAFFQFEHEMVKALASKTDDTFFDETDNAVLSKLRNEQEADLFDYELRVVQQAGAAEDLANDGEDSEAAATTSAAPAKRGRGRGRGRGSRGGASVSASGAGKKRRGRADEDAEDEDDGGDVEVLASEEEVVKPPPAKRRGTRKT